MKPIEIIEKVIERGEAIQAGDELDAEDISMDTVDGIILALSWVIGIIDDEDFPLYPRSEQEFITDTLDDPDDSIGNYYEESNLDELTPNNNDFGV